MVPFIVLVLLMGQGIIAADKTCYGLDGTKLDSTYGPCKPGARHSGCCAIHRPAGSVDICLDNGLCMATDGEYMGTIWQDGCTDPTGKDPGCPKMCPDGKLQSPNTSSTYILTHLAVNTNFNGSNPVLAWNVQMCDYGSYCCRAVNDRNNCCNNATAPKIQTNFLGQFQFETSTAGLTSTPTPTLTPAAISTTTQAALSVAATAISTGEPFSQATATPLPRPEEICKKDKSAVVGGAVGGTLGAALLGLVGIIIWMHRKEKRQRRLKEHYETQFGQNFAYRRTVVLEADSSEVHTLGTPDTRSEKDAVVTEMYHEERR